MRRAGILALAAALAGFSPFQAEERNVREGNERLTTGDPAGALERYQAAEKAAGGHPEIEYDRGNALFRSGRGAEAREAWRRSQQRAPGSLSSRASQNIGTALAAGGDRDGAIAAFTEALRQDPRNEDARFDLEVLLRRKQQEEEQKKQEQQQGQGKQGPPRDQGGGSASPSPSGGQPQPPDAGRPPPGAPPRGAQQGGPRPEAGPQAPPDRREDGAGRQGEAGEDLSRQDAERILDAFRAQDRIAPPPDAERRARRADGDRDW